MGRREADTGFWWGDLRERDHLGIPGIDGRIILRGIFMKWVMGVWTGSSWLRIGTGGEHPTFYGSRKFITAFTSARHLSLS
jgi:hypothetical protein